VIRDEAEFRRVLADAFDLASRGQAIVTIGVQPTEPATAYGYIRVGEPLPPPRGGRPYRTVFHRAERFVEKPALAQAREYVESGQYRWNAGMFIWAFATIIEGLQRHQPEFYEACQRWFQAASKQSKLARVLARDYPELRKVSIDYALMEHAQNVVVADGDFGWDDVGSWDAMARHLKPDAAGNVAIGELVHVDAARNIVVDARSSGQTPVALVAQRDTVVVLTDDAILVVPKTETQRIKDLVRRLAAHRKLRALT
jgi:mannose-1-phosphate guanylyltransferase